VPGIGNGVAPAQGFKGIDMNQRVNLGQAAPDLYQAVLALEQLASDRATKAGIEKGLAHLLRLAVVINAWNRIAIASRYPVEP
jgi:hypothetical protein